jgi:ribosomal protein L40E
MKISKCSVCLLIIGFLVLVPLGAGAGFTIPAISTTPIPIKIYCTPNTITLSSNIANAGYKIHRVYFTESFSGQTSIPSGSYWTSTVTVAHDYLWDVTWSPVSGYGLPSPSWEAKNLINNSCITFIGNYIGGNITVNTNLASASYTITGPGFSSTGTGTSKKFFTLKQGSYTISFNAVSGYTPPAPQTLSVDIGRDYIIQGQYVVLTTTNTTVPASVTGNISVVSSPSNAEVYLDGTLMGNAPQTLNNISTGTHIIWCKRTGYEDFMQSVDVPSGGFATLTCLMTLTPISTGTATPTGTVTPTATPPPEKLKVSIASKSEKIETETPASIEVVVTMNGAPVLDSIVKLYTTNCIVTPNSGITDSSGRFISTVKCPVEGTANVMAQVSKDGMQGTNDVNIIVTNGSSDWTLIAIALIILIFVGVGVFLWNKGRKKVSVDNDSEPEGKSIEVIITPALIEAGEKSSATVTLKVIDKFGNPISSSKEKTVNLTTTLGSISKNVVIPPKTIAGTTVMKVGKIPGITYIHASISEKGKEEIKGKGELEITEGTKRYCMHCGTKMLIDAQTCNMCGKTPPSDVETKVCSCNVILPQIAKYCDKCGARQPV